MLDLIVSSDGDIPLFFRTASGNEADKAVFGQIIHDYQQQINFDSIMVCDSALYSATNLEIIKNYKWICHVPFTVKKAKELAESLDIQEFQKAETPGYSYVEKNLNHSGVQQRWLIVESETRKQSDLTNLSNKISKEAQKIDKFLQKYQRQKYDDLAEIKQQVKQFNRQLKYHQIQSLNYPEFPVNQSKSVYSISGRVVQLSDIISAERNRAGRFILATNVLDTQLLSSAEIFSNYKAQQSDERGFRFLKDPLFFADSVFLKSPRRIQAMAMLMGLALLVYSLAQRYLRNQLQFRQSTVKNQLGKPVNHPTLRWIFQLFQGIHFLTFSSQKQVNNLTEELINILHFFPESCQRYYLISTA